MCISLNLEPEKHLIFSELGPLQALQVEADTFHFELISLSVKGTNYVSHILIYLPHRVIVQTV